MAQETPAMASLPYRMQYGDAGSGTPYDVGLVDDGFELEYMYEGELITADNLGTIVQEVLYRATHVFLTFTGLQYNTLSTAGPDSNAGALSWFPRHVGGSSVPVGGAGFPGQMIGRPASANDKSFMLNLTPRNIATLTESHFQLVARRAILAENFPVRVHMASRLRRTPFRFRLLPYDSNYGSGTPAIKFFERTVSGSNPNP